MKEETRIKILPKIKILSKEQTYEIYNDRFFFDSLDKEERKIVYRSLCFWDISYFAVRVTDRWTTSKKTNNRYKIPDFHKELWDVAFNYNLYQLYRRYRYGQVLPAR